MYNNHYLFENVFVFMPFYGMVEIQNSKVKAIYVWIYNSTYL